MARAGHPRPCWLSHLDTSEHSRHRNTDIYSHLYMAGPHHCPRSIQASVLPGKFVPAPEAGPSCLPETTAPQGLAGAGGLELLTFPG